MPSREFKQSDPHPNWRTPPPPPWGKAPINRLLRHAYENPNKWWRSHPLSTKVGAKGYTAHIRRGTINKQVHCHDGKPGHYEAEWGPDVDERTRLEMWFVWAKWVPEKKKREPRSGK